MTQEKTHVLLEKLTEYVMNTVPRRDEVATKSEVEKIAAYMMNEVPTKREMNARFEQVDQRFEQVGCRFEQIDRRLDRVESDVKETKENVKLILNGMDAQVKEIEIVKTEQAAIKSGLARVEKRVDVLEKE